MISQSTIEEIKDRANLVELIGESVQLRRQGSSYTGLCPFHQEKTPSFHIRDAGKFYHCFGCGASGTAISYVMETKGLSFPEAIEELASRFGITVRYESGRSAEKQIDKSIYYNCNRLAQEFFVNSLSKAPREVLAYVEKRGLDRTTLENYGIGFSPAQWHGLTSFLKSKKVPDELVLSLGLARRNQRGELYDAFRSRLIFPIYSDSRNIVGFGGRSIPALVEEQNRDQTPKYINSPESVIYHKSKTLYGLPQAFQAIKSAGSAYIVEGYMDVVSLARYGVLNVAATCGTALTEAHVKRLSFLCKRVHILFDGDTAGRNAAAKSFSVFLNSGVDATILFLPQGDDPDSLAQQFKQELGATLAALPSHTPLDCFIDSLLSRLCADSVQELGAALKGQLCDEVAAALAKVKNAVERDELARQASFKLLVEPDRFFEVMGRERHRLEERTTDKAASHPAAEQPRRKRIADLPRLDQELLLACMGCHDDLTGSILKDSVLMDALDGASRNFVEGLHQIISDAGLGREEKKIRTKELLGLFGESWFGHWRKAHEMSQDPRVNLHRVYSECARQARKGKLNQAITEINKQISQTRDEAQKLILVNEKVALTKKMGQL
ncbi:MAG: DNA primase [Deltaproteobacteria bacterium]|nr:DNA primase [Deltaproteobacteria bacterium]